MIGSNCSNGMKLKKELRRAIQDNEMDIVFTEDNDDLVKKKYRIQNIPALVINDDVVSQGKVLTEREISKLIAQKCLS